MNGSYVSRCGARRTMISLFRARSEAGGGLMSQLRLPKDERAPQTKLLICRNERYNQTEAYFPLSEPQQEVRHCKQK